MSRKNKNGGRRNYSPRTYSRDFLRPTPIERAIQEANKPASPQAVAVSCGLNNDYGHPHREVIQEMQDEGIDFYRTDLYGTVTVTAQADGSFTVQTAKQPDEELAPAA